MATMQRLSTSSVRSGSTTNLVAAKPLARRFCFQPLTHASTKQQRCLHVRSMPKIVAAAAVEAGPDNQVAKPPPGFHWYETMIILKPSLTDDERDREMAKFEAYLNKEECFNINSIVKGRSRLAYPIKNEWEGTFVVYTYVARRQTARAIQLLLSKPEAGAEDTIMRHITICQW